MATLLPTYDPMRLPTSWYVGISLYLGVVDSDTAIAVTTRCGPWDEAYLHPIPHPSRHTTTRVDQEGSVDPRRRIRNTYESHIPSPSLQHGTSRRHYFTYQKLTMYRTGVPQMDQLQRVPSGETANDPQLLR